MTRTALTIAVLVAMCACSAEDSPSGDSAPPTTSGARDQTAPAGDSSDTELATTPATVSETTAEGAPADEADTTASKEDSADVSDPTSQEGSEVDQGPPPGGESEETMAPAGFADPSSIVQEDSFDGADLVIQSITIDDSGPVRIRFDLDGQGFPGWQAQYSDEGSPFEPGGGATLQVVLRGVSADGVVPADLPTSELVEVRTGQSDDGDLVVFLGMEEAPVPFRIQLQHSPLRLEVDLSSEG